MAERKECQLKHKELDLALLYAIKVYSKDYELDSLRTMLAALDYDLRENQKPSNILVDKDFL